MPDIAQMLQGRPHRYNLLQFRLFSTPFFKVHDRNIADLDCGIVQLGCHELQCPVGQVREGLEYATKLMRCEQACWLQNQ